MLLNSLPKPGDIVSIRLTTGEEVIGKLGTSTTTSEVVMEKPALLHLRQTPDGLDVSFGAPMVSGETETLTFFTSALMARPTPTKEQIRQGYQQATGGIITPPKGIIKP